MSGRYLRPFVLPKSAIIGTGHGEYCRTAFALPRALTEKGVRRYGFHGLSYEYIASILPAHLGPGADGKVVVAHLGNGASMCAMRNRRSVATTMGLSVLDGLVMGRRCGALDPGVVLYLMDSALPRSRNRTALKDQRNSGRVDLNSALHACARERLPPARRWRRRRFIFDN